MHAVPNLLLDLALIIGVAALTSLACRKLHLPSVLGYVLAGLLVGPLAPVPLVREEASLRTLADLGVILLMFGIGLEFSLARLALAGPTALLMGSVQVGFTMALGSLAARFLGFHGAEPVFLGAALAISSTMLLSKLFEEQRPPRAVRESVFSVLVIQDLFAILLLTGLPTLVQGRTPGMPGLGEALIRLVVFLVLVLGLGRLLVPRLLRRIADRLPAEALLMAALGLCFGLAVGAAVAGLSLALGAFLAGMLGCESGRGRAMEHLVAPVRDLFTAVFFVTLGMLVQPMVMWTHGLTILLLSALVIGGNALGLTGSGLLAGLSFRTSLRTGLALGQAGEFGYILVGAGIALGALRPELYSVVVGVGLLTAVVTPLLLRSSRALSAQVEERLPAGFRNSLGLYQAWAESLRRRGIRHGEGRALRRPALFLLLDAALLLLLTAGHHLLFARSVQMLEARIHLGHLAAQGFAAILLGMLGALLVLGILRQGRILAREMAVLAPSPEAEGSGRRGRHLLAGGLRVAVVLTVGLPLVALLQPLAPRGPLLAIALGVFTFTVVFQLLRARRLAREVPGGTEWLLARVRDPWPTGETAAPAPHGSLRTLRIGSSCPSLGRSLGEVDLPGRAGVSLVLLLRKDGSTVPLHPSRRLEEGDVIGLVGSDAALEDAEAMLGEG